MDNTNDAMDEIVKKINALATSISSTDHAMISSISKLSAAVSGLPPVPAPAITDIEDPDDRDLVQRFYDQDYEDPDSEAPNGYDHLEAVKEAGWRPSSAFIKLERQNRILQQKIDDLEASLAKFKDDPTLPANFRVTIEPLDPYGSGIADETMVLASLIYFRPDGTGFMNFRKFW